MINGWFTTVASNAANLRAVRQSHHQRPRNAILDQSIVDEGLIISLGVEAAPVSDPNHHGQAMPKGPKEQKRAVASTSPAARALERWENEGGAPDMGDQSHKKGAVEPFVGDFLQHPGSVGEMHFPYDNRNKDARRTSRLANSQGFDWREWLVPPIVIPGAIIAVLVARTFYLYL